MRCAAARSGEWAEHFSNASCLLNRDQTVQWSPPFSCSDCGVLWSASYKCVCVCVCVSVGAIIKPLKTMAECGVATEDHPRRLMVGVPCRAVLGVKCCRRGVAMLSLWCGAVSGTSSIWHSPVTLSDPCRQTLRHVMRHTYILKYHINWRHTPNKRA